MEPELYRLSPIDKIRATLADMAGQKFTQYMAGPHARGFAQQSMLEQGYQPDSDLASQMFYERSLGGGEQVPMRRGIGNPNPNMHARVTNVASDGMLLPGSEVELFPGTKTPANDDGFLFSDLPTIARHESSHTRQGPYPAATQPALAHEVGPAMGDLMQHATAFRQQTGRELDHSLFPPEANASYNPSLDWMSRMAEKHRFPQESMNNLLATPVGRAWLKMLSQSPGTQQ